MVHSYRQFSGRNLGRLAALSDGIFAVAMTLLVLNVHVPIATVLHAEQPPWTGGSWQAEGQLLSTLAPLGPQLLTYFMSFLTLGIFWAGQQTQLNHFSRSDHRLTWIHLSFLLAVVLMPFSTNLLAGYITYRLPMAIYWVNLLMLGVLLYVSLKYASHAGLLSPDATEDIGRASERRIIVYQVLYAGACLLCVVNTYLAIAVLVLLQLNSVIVPPIPPLNRF
jgi:TMEM175 potassium channel family protein